MWSIYFQLNSAGIFSHEEVTGEKEIEENGILHPIQEGQFTLEDLEGEVLQFPTNCPGCGSPCETNMKMTSILYLLIESLLFLYMIASLSQT